MGANIIYEVIVMNDEQKYILDKVLSRIDSNINAVNSKASFFIAFNTFILGTIILKHNEIIESFTYQKFKIVIPILLLVITVGVGYSLYNVLKAIEPYLESGDKPAEPYLSLLFFGSISKLTVDEYMLKIENINKDLIKEDFMRQIHVLSKGLDMKFDRIKKSTRAIIYLILLPLGVLALFKVIESFI